jgi:ribosomal protein S18 acetylase RimI-like enzyme
MHRGLRVGRARKRTDTVAIVHDPHLFAMTQTTLRHAVPRDASRCFEIESTAYEGDEAATLEKIVKRIDVYPQGFLVLEVDDEIVGFINCGCADQVRMSDSALKELVGHDPAAPNVVIMSVAVAPARQGQGFSKLLMAEFLRRMRVAGKREVHLMCKQVHIELYRRMGYDYVKQSASNHGGMSWHEMIQRL